MMRKSVVGRGLVHVLWYMPQAMLNVVWMYFGPVICVGCEKPIRRLKYQLVCRNSTHDHPIHHFACGLLFQNFCGQYVQSALIKPMTPLEINDAIIKYKEACKAIDIRKARIALTEMFHNEVKRLGIAYEHYSFGFHEISLRPVPGREHEFESLRQQFFG